MPVITHSFGSKDPLNNLTAEKGNDSVVIHVHEYNGSTSIELSIEEARRLAETLIQLAPDKPLGYKNCGTPIYPAKPGFIYTQATVVCAGCTKAIRSTGGPMFGALCFDCHEASCL